MIKSCKFLLTFTTTMLVVSTATYATEIPAASRQIIVSNQKDSLLHSQNNFIAQVTSVPDSSDLKPTDWAFQALQSLVKYYGCTEYPNAKFPSNQAIRRDKFTIALNTCLNRVNKLLATTADSNTVKQEDLVNIKKLQQAFQVELARFRGRDAMTANTPSVPENQSSPRSKPTADKPPEPNPKPDETKKQAAPDTNPHLQSQVTKLATQIPEKDTTVPGIGVKQLAESTETVAVPVPGTVNTSADQLHPNSPTSDSPVSQAPGTAPPATPTAAKKPKYKFSYLGIGVNFGSGGKDSALSETSFAAFSKFALSPSFSVRPALLVNQNTTVFLPVTYDFPLEGPGHIAPYVGLGIQSSSPFSAATTKTDLLLTAGIDYPINSHLALTGGVNLGTFNSSGVGGLLGLAYTFNTPPGRESSTTVSPQSNATPSSETSTTNGTTVPPSGDKPASDSSTTTEQAPKAPTEE